MEPNETCDGKHSTSEEGREKKEAEEVQVSATYAVVQECAVVVESSDAVVAEATVAALWWLLEHPAAVFQGVAAGFAVS